MTAKEFEEKQSDSKPQERKPAEVRRFEILYAAKELFCERGLDRVSMDDVAEKVGISKAAVYLYFKSKLELYFEMLLHEVDKLIRGLEEGFWNTAHHSLVEKLDSIQGTLQEYAPVFRSTQTLMHSGMPDTDFPPQIVREFTKKIIPRRERIQKIFIDVLKKAQEIGEVREDLPAEELSSFFALYGMLLTRSEIRYETAKEVLFHGILSKEDRR